MFWASAIVKDGEHGKPMLISFSEGNLKLEQAMNGVNFLRENYIVLSAWVDTFDEQNNKSTVFHECYINAFGDVDTSKRPF